MVLAAPPAPEECLGRGTRCGFSKRRGGATRRRLRRTRSERRASSQSSMRCKASRRTSQTKGANPSKHGAFQLQHDVTEKIRCASSVLTVHSQTTGYAVQACQLYANCSTARAHPTSPVKPLSAVWLRLFRRRGDLLRILGSGNGLCARIADRLVLELRSVEWALDGGSADRCEVRPGAENGSLLDSVSPATLEATQGQILSQSPTDASSGR